MPILIPAYNHRLVYIPENWDDKQVKEVANYLYTDIPFSTAKRFFSLLLPTLTDKQIETLLFERLPQITGGDNETA